MDWRLGRFVKDQRGTSFEGIALSVSIIAVAFVASADMLDYVTKPPEQSGMMVAMRHARPATAADPNLDETPTATVRQFVTRSVLDPCTGQTK